ncbi:MAG TPA: IPT/TIG domain-containing protein [Drouetiella sp.]
MSREKITRTAATILAAFSLSIGSANSAISKTSKYAHSHHAQADQQLIAGFPFRKKKDETKSNATQKEKSSPPENANGNSSQSSPNTNPGNESKLNTNAVEGTASKTAEPATEKIKEATPNKSSDKNSKDPDNEDVKAQRKNDAKKAKSDEKAAAKAREAQEDAQKEAAKAEKKAEKRKQKDDKQRNEEAAARQAEESEKKAKQERDAKQERESKQEREAKQNKPQQEARQKQDAQSPPVTEQQRQVPANQSSGKAYTTDGALISLLKDLARSLKDPAEQSKLGDEDEKFVVQLALDVLNKALESRNDANRIVDSKSVSQNAMSAEAWSSGDVRVSNQCRGSLAAVWAKKENGLLNVTIAGACGDKVSPSGKAVGEYVVVLSARSEVQKGFDIQSQADVDFWLAKLLSVSVDAACCSGANPVDKTSSSGAGEVKELKKNSTVVLQAIMTERERLFNDQTKLTETTQHSEIAIVQPARHPAPEAATASRSRDEDVQRTASGEQTSISGENSTAAIEPLSSNADSVKAAQARKEKEQKKAAAEKQRQQDEEIKRAEAEKKQKQKEEEKRLEAENKRKLEEEDRKAEAEIKKRLEEDDRRAEAEERQKKEEKIRLAQAEKLRKANNKRQKIDDKHPKSEEKDQKNSQMTRDDVILAEAARQVELEQTQGITGLDSPANQMSSEQMTRADAILAEATRQAEAERREAADMRMPYGTSHSENNAIMPPVEIDDQQTPLRPRLTDLIGPADLSNMQSAASRSESTASQSESTLFSHSTSRSGSQDVGNNSDNSSEDTTSHRPLEYPTPPIERLRNSTSTLIAEREAAKGWDSPGLPANVKEPSSGSHMVLPGRAIAGQHITASVIDMNQNGESGIELGFNGVNLATDAHGQVTFMVPEDAVPGNSLAVSMVGKSQVKPLQIEVLQPLTTSSQQESPKIERASNLVSSNGTIIIDGHNFDGIADHNKIMVDENTECKITAASPVQLRATVPASVSPGVHFATVRVGEGKSNPGRFDLVNAEVRPDPREASKEQETKLVVKILGTTDRVQVHLTNESPDVIKISKGNDLRLMTSGGDENSITVPVQRLRKGSYRVDAVIE